MRIKKNVFWVALCMFSLVCVLLVGSAMAADGDKPYVGTWIDTDSSTKSVHKYIFSADTADYQIDNKNQGKFPCPATYTAEGKGYTVALSGMNFFYLEVQDDNTMKVCDAWNKDTCVVVAKEK